ncbi:MAG: tRNA (guanosine(37)-N1)-methyltransferase TrmD [Chlamydiia bacterium]|nr:tRNA (guanosine(37)-N1)-methyltransferase TrmD [Chlamydiia bacterium]
MKIDILSLFPSYFDSPFEESIIKRAQEKGHVTINQVNIRDFATDKHHRVDDRPYGGGPGMVLMADPIVRAIRHCRREGSCVIYLSPKGETLTSKKCGELKTLDHLILLCGHYEGVDERAIELEIDCEISIGDYVLTSGQAAAIVVVDAVVRLLPGVLGCEESAVDDSFVNGLLEPPVYTRPSFFEGNEVPRVLISGDHKKIAKWRVEESLKTTRAKRPDLYQNYLKNREFIPIPLQELGLWHSQNPNS